MTAINYAARVAKGAALLDEKRPGWERLIDLDTLSIESSCHCITAQLSGVNWYTDGADQLGLELGPGGTYEIHGFIKDSRDQLLAYAELDDLWKNLITERLSAGSTDG